MKPDWSPTSLVPRQQPTSLCTLTSHPQISHQPPVLPRHIPRYHHQPSVRSHDIPRYYTSPPVLSHHIPRYHTSPPVRSHHIPRYHTSPPVRSHPQISHQSSCTLTSHPQISWALIGIVKEKERKDFISEASALAVALLSHALHLSSYSAEISASIFISFCFSLRSACLGKPAILL